MKITRSIFALAILMAFTLQAEAKKVQLQYQLKAGNQFAYTLAVSQDIAQEMMGQSQTTTVGSSLTYSFKVLEVLPGGTYRMEGKLTEYTMNTNTPMGEMKYNSTTDKEIPDFAMSVALTLNEAFLFTLSTAGKITEVLAPAGLAEKIEKAMGENQDMSAQMMAGVAGGAGTAESFTKSVNGFFLNYPAEPIAVKKAFSNENKVENMVVFNTKTDYTLTGASKTENEIGVTAVITMADPSASMEVQGMNITYELSGGKQGTFTTDAVTGLFTKGESVTNISGVVSIESPQLPAPMSIPMSIKSTEKITRK
jgi:hypothetical protein